MSQDPRVHREAGFVLLRDLLRTRYPGFPTPSDLAREGGLQGEELPASLDNAFDTYSEEAFREAGVGRGIGVRGKGVGRGGGVSAGDNLKLAGYLAHRLEDEKSLAWYRLVVREVPRDIVQDALRRTLDVLPANIRRSRAALFTSLVRPLLRRRSRTP